MAVQQLSIGNDDGWKLGRDADDAGTIAGDTTVSGDMTVTGAMTLSGSLTASGTVSMTGSSMSFGNAGTDLVGFYGATPVDQGAFVTDATDAATAITQVNAVISRLIDIGILATS